MTTDAPKTKPHPRWLIKVLMDGDCPLCRREAELWRRLDAGRGRILLEDISDPRFDPSRYSLTRAAVMREIHGVLPTGEVVRGMDVFRRAYSAVGWGWLLAPTRWPIIKGLSDGAYRWFARHRLRLTGRSAECGGACDLHVRDEDRRAVS